MDSVARRLLLAGLASVACHAVWLLPRRDEGQARAVAPRLNARVMVQAPTLAVAARSAAASTVPALPLPVPSPDAAEPRRGEAMRLPDASNAGQGDVPDFSPRKQPDQPARLLSAIEFEAPSLPPGETFALAFRIEVTRAGRARKVELTGAGLDPDLAQLIKTQLESAHYRPAMHDGMAVDSVLEGGFAPVAEPEKKAGQPELTRD